MLVIIWKHYGCIRGEYDNNNLTVFSYILNSNCAEIGPKHPSQHLWKVPKTNPSLRPFQNYKNLMEIQLTDPIDPVGPVHHLGK